MNQINEVVFFLEEDSAKALLENLFPLLIPPGSEMRARYIVFEGKQHISISNWR